MRGRWILCCATILLFAVKASTPATALTGADVLDKMSNAEQTACFFGSAEMAAFMAHVAGNTERSRCITAWFQEKGVLQIVQTMTAMKDRQAQPIIYTLINRACGDS